MNHVELIAAALQQLRAKRAEISRQDLLKLLAKKYLQTTENDLRFGAPQTISAELYAKWQADMQLLLADYPWQYLLGETAFMGNMVAVAENVLIPRPDSEVLVEECLAILSRLNNEALTADVSQAQELNILEIGVGSGALALGLLSNYECAHSGPQKQVFLCATDINVAALDLAKRNLQKYSDKVSLYEADLFPDRGQTQLHFGRQLRPNCQFQLIYSNPPYIAESEKAELPASVLNYEPGNALFAEADGLAYYAEILALAPQYLTPGAYLLFEHGYLQKESIIALAANCPSAKYSLLKSRQDYNGLDRVLLFKLDNALP